MVESSLSVNLRELVISLSEALGLVSGRIDQHGLRVAVIALNLGRRLGLSPETLDSLCTASLLHHTGVSCTRIQPNLRLLDWAGANEVCREGAGLLREYGLFQKAASIVARSRTRWIKLAEDSALDAETALAANILFLADRIDILLDWQEELIIGRSRIEGQIKDLTGTHFNSDAVKAFLEASRTEAFWLSLYPRHVKRALSEVELPEPAFIGLEDLETVAGIFARVVDNKSRFTLDHSPGVARLCRLLAARAGRPPETVRKLGIAGLFHDLGKLAVPDEILDKPAQLTMNEFQVVKRHTYETYHILSYPPGLEDIRDWASFHHERADGSGYPFHLKAENLQIEHTIVTLADIIEALVQERPHRASLGRDHIMDILDHMAFRQTNFGPVLELIRRDFEQVVRVAQGLEDAS